MADFVPLMIALLNGLLVFDDARKRDWSESRFANKAWKWALGALLLWIIVTPLYLVHRRRHPTLAAT